MPVIRLPDGSQRSFDAPVTVDTDAFKDAAAVMQRVGKHVHLRLVPGDDLAVHPNIVSPHGHDFVLLALCSCPKCFCRVGKVSMAMGAL